jgi:hypothetical protein
VTSILAMRFVDPDPVDGGRLIARSPLARRRRNRFASAAGCLASIALLVLGASTGSAAETQWWTTDSPGDYAKADAHGVLIRPDGSLELGPAAKFTAAESLDVVWAVTRLKDGTVVVGGDRGRVLRFEESGGFRVLARLPVGQVLSLLPDGDGVIAGTGPDGLVYRIGPRGDTTLVARTGERYVWGLAPAGGGGWYAATGTRGRLMRITGHTARIVLDTEESNLVSLVADGKGAVYAGGDSKGRVYRVADGRPLRTVFDAAEDEVRALAIGADGALYAAALSASAVTEEDGDSSERPAPVRSAVANGRAVIYRIVPDSAVSVAWTSAQPFVFALASLPQGVVVATGNRAAIYQIERPNGATQWLQGPQGQITALASDGRGRLWAGTSNPGGLWRVGPEKAPEGDLVSPVFDARRYARFGALRWQGTAGGGHVALSSRSGNCDPPDTTWSAWTSAGAGDGERGRSTSPPARFLQWKLTLSGGAPHVTSVESAWREQNLAPRVEELSVAPQGQNVKEGEMTPRTEAVTQVLPGGQKVEYSFTSPSGPRTLRSLPNFAHGLRTLQWRGVDPNGDPLRYTIQICDEAGGDWITIDKDLEPSAFSWDTNALPDGRYRIRVIASDAPGNSVGEELTGEGISEPFVIDNTAPTVTEFEASAKNGAVLTSGRAEDRTSALSRVEVSVDDDEWKTVTPDGGFTDERSVSFHARLPVEAGDHTISVRAVDSAGNSATRATRVTVPKPR